MSTQDSVVGILKRLNLLAPTGQLRAVDSLGILDFVEALEAELSISLPSSTLTAEAFESVEAIVALVDEHK